MNDKKIQVEILQRYWKLKSWNNPNRSGKVTHSYKENTKNKSYIYTYDQ